MSASGTIGNLTQALNCAGKCDCCQNLQNQINSLNQKLGAFALKSDVAALDNKFALKSDLNKYILKEQKPEIINEAFYKMEGWVAPKFLALQQDFDGLKLALQLISFGLALLKVALEGLISTVNNFINWVRQEIPKLQRYIEEQINEIYKIINSKKTNYDAEIAELKRLVAEINGTATNANNTANKANEKSGDALTIADRALQEAKVAKQLAQKAIDEIAFVTERALAAMKRLEAFIRSEINFLTESTRNALLRLQRRIEIVEILANNANKNAVLAQLRADKAVYDANLSIKKSNESIAKANTAISKADTAIRKADTAISKADTANKTADNAVQKAEINSRKIQDILRELAALPPRVIQQIQPKITSVENSIPVKIEQGLSTHNQNIYSHNQLQNKLNQDFDKSVADNLNILFKGRDPFEGIKKLDQDAKKLNADFTKLADLQSKAAQGDKQAADKLEKIAKDNIDKFWETINNKERKLTPIIAPDIQKAVDPINKTQAQTKIDLDKLKKRIGDLEKMDKEANKKLDTIIPKLDSIIPTIAGIPIIVGRIPNTIAPMIPTIPQIGNIVQEKVCNPQCQLPSVTAANKANSDLGNKIDGLKNGADAAAQAAQLALLNTINKKMGAEIVGGLSGKLVDGFKWLHLDRILNVLTFAATVQNHLMLSNDIGQTLLGAFNNILQLIGIKDDKGQAINVGEVIGNTFENIVKGVVGVENYTSLSNTWAKANRIYQATTNVLNSFMSLTQTVLQASEMIAAYTGKIGNALRKGGVVLENAYGWMNPQPKFNRVTQTLENFQQAASTVQMVTQVPLDVISQTTELTNASTEFVKAVKEDTPANKAPAQPEPDDLKAKETQAKTDSQPSPFDFSDLFDGEDL